MVFRFTMLALMALETASAFSTSPGLLAKTRRRILSPNSKVLGRVASLRMQGSTTSSTGDMVEMQGGMKVSSVGIGEFRICFCQKVCVQPISCRGGSPWKCKRAVCQQGLFGAESLMINNLGIVGQASRIIEWYRMKRMNGSPRLQKGKSRLVYTPQGVSSMGSQSGDWQVCRPSWGHNRSVCLRNRDMKTESWDFDVFRCLELGRRSLLGVRRKYGKWRKDGIRCSTLDPLVAHYCFSVIVTFWLLLLREVTLDEMRVMMRTDSVLWPSWKAGYHIQCLVDDKIGLVNHMWYLAGWALIIHMWYLARWALIINMWYLARWAPIIHLSWLTRWAFLIHMWWLTMYALDTRMWWLPRWVLITCDHFL